ARQLLLIDPVEVAPQREERFGGEVFGQFLPADDAQRKPEDRLDVPAIDVLEATHRYTNRGIGPEDSNLILPPPSARPYTSRGSCDVRAGSGVPACRSRR